MGTYNNLTQTYFYGKELKCFNRVYYKKDNVNTNLLVDNKKYDVIKHEWDNSEGWDYESYEITGEYPELETMNMEENVLKNIQVASEIPTATNARTITKNSTEDIINDAVIHIYNEHIYPSIKEGKYSVTFTNRSPEYLNLQNNDKYPNFSRMDLIKTFFENKGYKCKYGTSFDGRNELYENQDILEISWE